MLSKKYGVAVLVASDKCSKNERIDTSGICIKDIIENEEDYIVEEYKIVSDDLDGLKETLEAFSLNEKVHLILTTGGTGFSKRDHTPEATLAVADKLAMGIAEAIRAYSMTITKRAMLSRAVSVIANDTLIVNLPGSPKAVEEALLYILPELKHGLDILNAQDSECARS